MSDQSDQSNRMQIVESQDEKSKGIFQDMLQGKSKQEIPRTTNKKKITELIEGKKGDQVLHHSSEQIQREQESVGKIEIRNKRILNRGKLSANEMKNILKTKNIYESTSKIALAKFLMRMFENYSDEMQFPPEVRVHNEWILEEIRSQLQNKYNMKRDICRLLSIGDGRIQNKSINKFNRQLMRYILRNHIKDEVIFNSTRKKNKRSYFLSIRVYLLRCMHQSLPQRSCYR